MESAQYRHCPISLIINPFSWEDAHKHTHKTRYWRSPGHEKNNNYEQASLWEEREGRESVLGEREEQRGIMHANNHGASSTAAGAKA